MYKKFDQIGEQDIGLPAIGNSAQIVQSIYLVRDALAGIVLSAGTIALGFKFNNQHITGIGLTVGAATMMKAALDLRTLNADAEPSDTVHTDGELDRDD